MITAAEPTRQERTIIVHCHIFKNAGSSLDWALRRNFGGAFLDHRDDKAMQRGAAYLGPLLEANPALRALSSHRVVFPLPQVPGARLVPAFLIRNPIERAYSVYQFDRVRRIRTPAARMAKKLDFRNYVAWRLESSVSRVIRNFQTNYCTGLLGAKERQLDETDLEAAKATLKSTPMVGLVEQFDESMVVFEQALRSYFPHIDLAYIHQNAGQELARAKHGLIGALVSRLIARPTSIPNDSLVGPDSSTVLQMLGPDLAGKLVQRNALDAALHAWSANLLRSRLEQITGWEQRLQDFRERCASLRDGQGAGVSSHIRVTAQ